MTPLPVVLFGTWEYLGAKHLSRNSLMAYIPLNLPLEMTLAFSNILTKGNKARSAVNQGSFAVSVAC